LSGEKADLAETIFGYTYGNNALKGRVHVGHCTAKKSQGSNTYKEIKTTLLGPKPTFYPNYLKQKHNSEGKLISKTYQTYNDSNAEIRGWKRYPVPRDGYEPHTPEPETEKVATAFTPLPAGTTFTGNIRIHNLRPPELGAVLWALTWGNNPSLRHSIGMGKPYGFGSITIAITSTNLKNMSGESIEWQNLISTFENMMEKEIPGWKKSAQLKQLCAMAHPDKSFGNTFTYPPVDDFRQYKNKKLVLPSYIDIVRKNKRR
jgi:CRISPR-associated protein (TIGR03986 family)